MNRTETRPIKVANLQIGGQNKVIIQSMANTKTKNIPATVKQINELQAKGCQLVRLAILDQDDALAVSAIKDQVELPLVADIHFDYKLALLAIQQGIDKIRLNPGNIANKEHITQVVAACKKRKIPLRIGINAGSLEKELLQKYNKPGVEAMIESAQRHVKILEDLDFFDICLSFKASDPQLCIASYQAAASIFPYPLHLGVTEAGDFFTSSVRSSAALGTLLSQGIGDTIRISVSGDPLEEIKIAKELLNCFGLMPNYAQIIACPTCGRLQYDMLKIIPPLQEFLSEINRPLKVAVMGCVVNGPGEASQADIGVAGGIKEALLFKHGRVLRKIAQTDILNELIKEIEAMLLQ